MLGRLTMPPAATGGAPQPSETRKNYGRCSDVTNHGRALNYLEKHRLIVGKHRTNARFDYSLTNKALQTGNCVFSRHFRRIAGQSLLISQVNRAPLLGSLLLGGFK